MRFETLYIVVVDGAKRLYRVNQINNLKSLLYQSVYTDHIDTPSYAYCR